MKKNYNFSIVYAVLIVSTFLTTNLFAQKSATIEGVQTEDGKSRVVPVSINDGGAPVSIKRVVNDKETEATSIIYVNKQEVDEESINPSSEINVEPE
ncbi:MAG: hypothetical protein HYU68_05550 [Bacteroidetes bacterium]|nr:hypothetical protein [Bacteroidota bacterium]